MFGIGPQELVIIVFLLLLIFGPQKLGSMAKEMGRWLNEARGSVEEFKEELTAKKEPEEEPPETVEVTETPSAKPAQGEETQHKKSTA